MASRYEIFCKAIETGNFTRTAEEMGYSQSAISQAIKTLEGELGHTLIDRRKDGVVLSRDGQAFFPYIQDICAAETALRKKCLEMKGMENTVIRVGAFTSVTRNRLPALMKEFKKQYPNVRFEVQQGDYTVIEQMIRACQVDLGFIITDTGTNLDHRALCTDRMMAVLPQNHPLAREETVTLAQLAKENFILLDEGDYSGTMLSFQRKGLTPPVEYKVHDDYSILLMVQNGMGVSMVYQMLLNDYNHDILIKPIADAMERTIALAWNNWSTLPRASRKFAEFILKNM